LTDSLGYVVDCKEGQHRGDYIATITGTRVTLGGVRAARTELQAASVVDRLLAHGELAEVKRSVRAQGEKRIKLAQRVLRFLRGT
jgi:hypothetical protein